MSGSQVYNQRKLVQIVAMAFPDVSAIIPQTDGSFDVTLRSKQGFRLSSEAADELRALVPAVCHCGIDGHPLGSVNCPVHGEKIRRDAEEHYAKLAMERRTRALAAAMTSNQIAITADVLKTLEREITSYDLDEDADAYEAAAREEFEHQPSRPNAVCFDFDAIRYHLNVMHGDDINGTTYLHHTRQGGPSAIRAHDFDPLTQRCTACLWSAQHVLDRIINHCEGRPPKGEPCMNCGKPHVVSIQHRGNWMTQCLSCFQGVMTNGPIKDRGAVRFEQRMKERAERDYAKGRGLQAVEDYINFLPSPLSPGDRAAVQALIDSAHMGGMGMGRIAGPTRAERMAKKRSDDLGGFIPLPVRAAASEARNLHPAILKTLAAYEAAMRAPRQGVDDAGAPIPPGETHPEGCGCDVCVPF